MIDLFLIVIWKKQFAFGIVNFIHHLVYEYTETMFVHLLLVLFRLYIIHIGHPLKDSTFDIVTQGFRIRTIRVLMYKFRANISKNLLHLLSPLYSLFLIFIFFDHFKRYLIFS